MIMDDDEIEALWHSKRLDIDDNKRLLCALRRHDAAVQQQRELRQGMFAIGVIVIIMIGGAVALVSV